MAVNLNRLYEYTVKSTESTKISGLLELALTESAISARKAAAPNPVTGVYVASMNFANRVLRNPKAVAADALVPVLVELNTTNKLDNGLDSIGQGDVRTVVTALWNVLAGYVPPLP